jgi:hypothetical protein
MPFRDAIKLRTERHRTRQKWLFGFIFILAVVAICWLFCSLRMLVSPDLNRSTLSDRRGATHGLVAERSCLLDKLFASFR